MKNGYCNGDVHTVPGKGERTDIEDDENVGDQFGKTREEAEGECDGRRSIRFQEWECTPGEVTTTCNERRHQDMQALTRV
jgi:hypothetical protein